MGRVARVARRNRVARCNSKNKLLKLFSFWLDSLSCTGLPSLRTVGCSAATLQLEPSQAASLLQLNPFQIVQFPKRGKIV